jgi:hypothetical protein
LGLLDEIAEQQEKVMPLRCTVGIALSQLPDDEREELEAALANSDYMHSVISSVLVARGHNVGRGAVSHHRRGRCGCARG